MVSSRFRSHKLPGRAGWYLAAAWLLIPATSVLAAAEPMYAAGRCEKGELRYVDGLPVLIVAGSPEEIGRQKAALTADVTKKLSSYPRDLLRRLGLERQWPSLVEKGRTLLERIHPDHLAELHAFADATGMDREQGVVGNTLVDMYRGGFGCSSLMVAPQRSATGGTLMGRNLDFFTLGRLQQYSLVTVHRPQGKRAFVSIGFPGMFGCLSGMNDAGLAVAVHEVLLAGDGSAMFNPKGVPYTFCFRRILEECATIEEAEKLLRSTERTTRLNLAVCDRRAGAVLEMTPKSLALREGEGGLCICTNHFRTKDLVMFALCRRYTTLARSESLPKFDVAAVGRKLDEVNQGSRTIQTMIFEPATLVLHLAIGGAPSSSLPLKRLDLKLLFSSGS